MREEIDEYVRYLLNFSMVKKPSMPKFNVSAYSDKEYLQVVNDIQKWFNGFDEEVYTIRYLKGE